MPNAPAKAAFATFPFAAEGVVVADGLVVVCCPVVEGDCAFEGVLFHNQHMDKRQ